MSEPLAAGVVLFDTPASQDQVVTVIIPAAQLARLPNRTFVEIRTPTPRAAGVASRLSGDGRPRAVPRAGWAPRGPTTDHDHSRPGAQLFLPPYHGRAEVQVLGEWVEEGGQRLLRVLRFRPLPGSLVTPLPEVEVQRCLCAEGDLHLGRAVGYAGIGVAIPTQEKSVLPRHLAIFGSSGSGKSTTVSLLIVEALRAGMTVVVLDVEGEYCFLHEPTSDPLMVRLLQEQGSSPQASPPSRWSSTPSLARSPPIPTTRISRPSSSPSTASRPGRWQRSST
ncbi:MAG: ATP-binding protein [Chloroflexi bacterium]|nr:ATP-binding protein [Chloroflexota bacterium]